ncbi:STAS/SEC14 domain-containing protein [Pseudoalteromonas ruthenica]|uniref:STAS/SEC14 domain-containing protein n=1 Tax=Pseudoalteromonas ruthenica TaxID=151081 RepID=UPI00211E7F70|nr:STAS/SEC14 domain-containing protein [Pseudoalteromonas ruthenica]
MAKDGLKVDIERHQQRIYIALVLTGTLNHEHYQLLTPLFASALADIDEPIVDVFIDASQLDGFTTRAMWDDFKLGLFIVSNLNA